MMAAMDKGADLSSLRLAVSAGETLPAPVFEDWTAKTGKPILDGIGTTELLHIFITNRIGDAIAGATGRPVSGYEAQSRRRRHERVAAPARVGQACGARADRLPLSRRHRQTNYVQNGWNITGDTFVRDADGALPLRRPRRRHDHLRRLQYRRSRGRSGAA